MTKQMRIFLNLFVVDSKFKDSFLRNAGNMFTIPLKRPSSCPSYNDLSIQIQGNFWKKVFFLVDSFAQIKDLEALIPVYLSKLDPNSTYSVVEVKHMRGAELDRDYLIGEVIDNEGDLIAILEKQHSTFQQEEIREVPSILPVFKKTEAFKSSSKVGEPNHQNIQDHIPEFGNREQIPQSTSISKNSRQKKNQSIPVPTLDQTIQKENRQNGKISGEKLSDTLSAIFNKSDKTSKPVMPRKQQPVKQTITAVSELPTTQSSFQTYQNKPESKPDFLNNPVELKAPIPVTKVAIPVVTPPITPVNIPSPTVIVNNISTFEGVDRQIETEFINAPLLKKDEPKKIENLTGQKSEDEEDSSSETDTSSSTCSSCEAEELRVKSNIPLAQVAPSQSTANSDIFSFDEKEDSIERPASNMPEPIITVPPEPVYKAPPPTFKDDESDSSEKEEPSVSDTVSNSSTGSKKFSSNLFAKIPPSKPATAETSPPKGRQRTNNSNKKKT
jgi:hypothetical protein